MKTKALIISSAIAAALLSPSAFAGKENGELHHQRGKTIRIIGGEVAEVGQFPYMTSLQDSQGHICGASFLGGKWVLTAAHCVNGHTGANTFGLSVVIGGHDLTNPDSGIYAEVANIYSHRDYNSPVEINNDMALLELTEAVDSPAISLITPEQMAALSAGDMLTVSGWGNTVTEGSPQYPEQLMHVNVPLVNHDVCNSPEAYDGGITDEMLCAGLAEGGKDSCQGDSGGPLVITIDDEFKQVGVVSWGQGCAQPNKYGVYAKAAKYNDWLNAITKGIAYDYLADFGAIEVNGTATKTINITNNGETNAILSGFTASGSGSENITVNSESCATIEALGSCELSIEYNAASAIGDDVQIAITSDNEYTPNITIDVSGVFLDNADSAVSEAVEAAENSNIQFFTDPANPWVVQTDTVIEGESAIQSATISDSESTYLLAKVSGPSKLMFDVKTDIEKNYDFLDIYLNGELKEYLTGSTDFQGRFIRIPEGEHRVTFKFVKDELYSEGADAVYLDGFMEYVAPTPPPAPAPAPAPTPPPVERKTNSAGGSVGIFGLLLILFCSAFSYRSRLAKKGLQA